jgi:hypothetical protein
MQISREYVQNALQDLPRIISEQREMPAYVRPKLVSLNPKDVNRILSLPSTPEGIARSVKEMRFYAWNAEGVEDYGWGCAYRAIQTSLSAYKVNTAIEELFHLFGTKKALTEIYSHKYPHMALEASKPFAPYELKEGWAEPFIGEMAMHFYGISSSLESVNGIPRRCNAPSDVFHRAPLTFEAFKKKLLGHFEAENAAPVMIDDASYAMNIVGIGQEGSLTKLWIADPHVKAGVNRTEDPQEAVGFFTITLEEDGSQKECSLLGEDCWQLGDLYPEPYYERLEFSKKQWMILFPEQRNHQE